MYMDATKELPFRDKTFDYILMEHTVEHFEYQVGKLVLQECHRVLTPGGKIRLSTPDLSFLIGLYTKEQSEKQKRYIVLATKRFIPYAKTYQAAFVINNAFRNWGHKFTYDFETLKSTLEKIGFTNIQRYEIGKSQDKNLQGVESRRDEFSVIESLVIEATKSIQHTP